MVRVSHLGASTVICFIKYYVFIYMLIKLCIMHTTALWRILSQYKYDTRVGNGGCERGNNNNITDVNEKEFESIAHRETIKRDCIMNINCTSLFYKRNIQICKIRLLYRETHMAGNCEQVLEGNAHVLNCGLYGYRILD